MMVITKLQEQMCTCMYVHYRNTWRNRTTLRRICFPEYIYFTHKQSYIHTNIHTVHTYYTYIQSYIHTNTYQFIWFFLFYYKKQFDILLLCILCYTVRARSLLKSMHFLLVVSRSCVCKWLQVCATGHSKYQIVLGLPHQDISTDQLSIKAQHIN